MAKKIKEELKPIETDMDVTDLEGLDPEDVEITEIAEEVAQATEGKKEKKEKKEGLTSTKALAEDEVGVAYVAELCGVEGRILRAFLRKNFRNMGEDKAKRYAWKKDDPQIQEIVDKYKAEKEKSRTEKAKDKVDKAEEKAAQVDAQIEEVETLDDLDDLEIEE